MMQIVWVYSYLIKAIWHKIDVFILYKAKRVLDKTIWYTRTSCDSV